MGEGELRAINVALEYLECSEQRTRAERQSLERRYAHRAAQIQQLHERQSEVLMRLGASMQTISSAASAAPGAPGREGVPLCGALVGEAGAVARAMASCLQHAQLIRARLALAGSEHARAIDHILEKLEACSHRWASAAAGAAHLHLSALGVLDNLRNLVRVHQRAVHLVCEAPYPPPVPAPLPPLPRHCDHPLVSSTPAPVRPRSPSRDRS